MANESGVKRILILGAGYVGQPLAHRMVDEGHEVWVASRTGAISAVPATARLKSVIVDVTDAGSFARLPGSFDQVINCVSSSRGGVEVYRAVFLDGSRNLIEWMKANPPGRVIFTSSTSVYGQVDGSLVDEESETNPAGETGRILVETERLWHDSGLPVTVLRIAGIYGPDRGHLFLKYLRGEAQITGDPNRYFNQIHRDDVVGAIATALTCDAPVPVCNVSDDSPISQIEFFQWLSDTLKRPLPAFSDGELKRKRAVTNKRVSNRRLKEELGWQLKYPTFRAGYLSEMVRLGPKDTAA